MQSASRFEEQDRRRVSMFEGVRVLTAHFGSMKGPVNLILNTPEMSTGGPLEKVYNLLPDH